MAAETISRHGVGVDLYDAMPSVGRKFLMAGKGGLNITHSEPDAAFCSRYGAREDRLKPLLAAFRPTAVRDWMCGLGVDSFVGSSGRVFPAGMKAAPLLRAWQQRLRTNGVRFHVRHRWHGWTRSTGERTALFFLTPNGERRCQANAVVLAVGGGSWARLGSDGRWCAFLAEAGVALAPLRPANCGFDVGWSQHLRERFAGQPVKPVVLSFLDRTGARHQRLGEFVLTATGVEGSGIYALSALLRDEIEARGSATLHLDLLPGYDQERVIRELARPRGARSLASHLQSRLRLKGVKLGLLHECLSAETMVDPQRLGAAIKCLPLRLLAPRPLDEAISSAGGVCFEALDERLMLSSLPGIFCAGEMLDWEAPTGGYLLTACLASGRAAGQGVLAWLGTTGQRPTSGSRLADEPPPGLLA